MKGKRILVTGGAGSIGSELVRQLAIKNSVYILDFNEVAAFDLSEELQFKGLKVWSRIGDVRNKDTVEEVFSDFRPHYVFHAAAYKCVTPMEQFPLEAINTNCIGTWNVVSAAKKWPVKKFVFISSDKAATSHSVMGLSKRLSEVLVRNQGKGFIVTRFGNVLNSRGSIIPLWESQINRGDPVTVTDERMTRYMMTIPEACKLVIKASKVGKGGEIFILDTGKKVNILSLAERIIKETGSESEIKMIGIRPGETLTEKWMTVEEEAVAKKRGDYWIIK